MRNLKKTCGAVLITMMSTMMMFSMTAAAEEYYEEYYEEEYYDDGDYYEEASYDSASSGDNSLYSLGLENASECTPDFYYSTLDYNVVVPKGTTELELSPVTSASDAKITDISGTKLEDGKATVQITVRAANGAGVTYTINVREEGAAGAETTETEKKEKETEKSKETVESEKALQQALKEQAESEAQAKIQEAVQIKQKQIDTLAAENSKLADRIDLLMKILYGLIGFAVVLLFFIINQSLRNKDLKDDIKDAKNQVNDSYDFARKEQNLQNDFYYASVRNMQQMNPGAVAPMRDMSRNMEQPFGTAPQQMAPEMPVEEKKELSKRELKKQAKAAEKAAKLAAKQAEKEAKKAEPEERPVQQPMQEPMMQQEQQQMPEPFEPTMVQATVEEPDVDLDMIDL